MNIDRAWTQDKKRAFSKAKWEYCDANPVWVKADRIVTLERQLAQAKGGSR